MFPAGGLGVEERTSHYFVHGTKGPRAQTSHMGWRATLNPYSLLAQKKQHCLIKDKTTIYFKTGHEPQLSLTTVVEYCVPTIQNVLLNCPLKSPWLETQKAQMAILNDSII